MNEPFNINLQLENGYSRHWMGLDWYHQILWMLSGYWRIGKSQSLCQPASGTQNWNPPDQILTLCFEESIRFFSVIPEGQGQIKQWNNLEVKNPGVPRHSILKPAGIPQPRSVDSPQGLVHPVSATSWPSMRHYLETWRGNTMLRSVSRPAPNPILCPTLLTSIPLQKAGGKRKRASFLSSHIFCRGTVEFVDTSIATFPELWAKSSKDLSLAQEEVACSLETGFRLVGRPAAPKVTQNCTLAANLESCDQRLKHFPLWREQKKGNGWEAPESWSQQLFVQDPSISWYNKLWQKVRGLHGGPPSLAPTSCMVRSTSAQKTCTS